MIRAFARAWREEREDVEKETNAEGMSRENEAPEVTRGIESLEKWNELLRLSERGMLTGQQRQHVRARVSPVG